MNLIEFVKLCSEITFITVIEDDRIIASGYPSEVLNILMPRSWAYNLNITMAEVLSPLRRGLYLFVEEH